MIDTDGDRFEIDPAGFEGMPDDEPGRRIDACARTRREEMKIIIIAFALFATVAGASAHGTGGKVCHKHGSQPAHCHSKP